MSARATTIDAVRWLSDAICNITCGGDAAIRSTFCTVAVHDAIVAMLPRATTNVTRQLLDDVVGSITSSRNHQRAHGQPMGAHGNHQRISYQPYVPWRTGGGRTPWGQDVSRLVLLGDMDAAEVAECTNLVQPFLPRGRAVTAVERVENARLYSRFLTKKSQIASENYNDANCVLVFHGTSANVAKDVALNEHGIDFRHGAAGFYGRAAYFSHRVEYVMSYASKVAGSQTALQFFVCEVARGKVEGPAVRDRNRIKPSAGCHCIEGDVSCDPAQVFMATMCYDLHQAYPRYLVTVDVRDSDDEWLDLPW